jgi:hypothetical protein
MAIEQAAHIGGAALSLALRPARRTLGVVVHVGWTLQRRAVDRILDSGEPQRLLTATVGDERVQDTVRAVLASDGANALINSLFDSGMLDQLFARLADSDALHRLIDEIASSPSVRATLSQQGLGWADQLGDVVRERSNRADRRAMGTAARVVHPGRNGGVTQ